MMGRAFVKPAIPKRKAVIARAALLTACLALVAGCTASRPDLFGVGASRQETLSFDVSGRPTLEIDTAYGEVTVVGVEGQTEILVEATFTSRGEHPESAAEHVERVRLFTEQDGDRVILQYRASDQDRDIRRYSGIGFSITTPPDADVEIETRLRPVTVENIRGDVVIETSRDSVTAHDVSGSLAATTTDGLIEVVGASGDLTLRTTMSNIHLREIRGTVDAATTYSAIRFSGTFEGQGNRLKSKHGLLEVKVSADAKLDVTARTLHGTISSALPVTGEQETERWEVTLGGPSDNDLELITDNAAIRIMEL